MRPRGKILDTIGTLELIDTGRRCSVRNVRILAVYCPKCVGVANAELLHDAIKDAYWGTMRTLNGYHQGCDPNSAWRKDPVGTKLQHDAMRSLYSPPDACIACDETTCTGAAS